MTRRFCLFLSLIECQSEKQHEQRRADDCQLFVEKVSNYVVSEKMADAMSDEEKTRQLYECRKNINPLKPDPTMQCVLDARDVKGISLCMKIAAEANDVPKRSVNEAPLMLNKIAKSAKAYFNINAWFPTGGGKRLPAKPCCDAANRKCAVTQQWATDKVWSALDFRIDEPNRFQYTYESDGRSALVTATGDLDCDGNSITYQLDVRIDDNGSPVASITEPPRGAD